MLSFCDTGAASLLPWHYMVKDENQQGYKHKNYTKWFKIQAQPDPMAFHFPNIIDRTNAIRANREHATYFYTQSILWYLIENCKYTDLKTKNSYPTAFCTTATKDNNEQLE